MEDPSDAARLRDLYESKLAEHGEVPVEAETAPSETVEHPVTATVVETRGPSESVTETVETEIKPKKKKSSPKA